MQLERLAAEPHRHHAEACAEYAREAFDGVARHLDVGDLLEREHFREKNGLAIGVRDGERDRAHRLDGGRRECGLRREQQREQEA